MLGQLHAKPVGQSSRALYVPYNRVHGDTRHLQDVLAVSGYNLEFEEFGHGWEHRRQLGQLIRWTASSVPNPVRLGTRGGPSHVCRHRRVRRLVFCELKVFARGKKRDGKKSA